jgi:cation transport ATPase
MAESEYETSLDSLMAPPQQMSQQMSQQQMPQQQMPQQMPQQQMSQEQLEYQQQMQQQMIQQQMIQQQMMQQQIPRAFSPPSGGLKFMEKLASVNYQETLQSIIIIAILFILFSNCYFKNFCKTLPFLCITDGEFNMQSLIILGIAAGICYIFIKMYLI